MPRHAAEPHRGDTCDATGRDLHPPLPPAGAPPALQYSPLLRPLEPTPSHRAATDSEAPGNPLQPRPGAAEPSTPAASIPPPCVRASTALPDLWRAPGVPGTALSAPTRATPGPEQGRLSRAGIVWDLTREKAYATRSHRPRGPLWPAHVHAGATCSLSPSRRFSTLPLSESGSGPGTAGPAASPLWNLSKTGPS